MRLISVIHFFQMLIDAGEALRWYKKAGEGGNQEAKAKVKGLEAQGVTVPKK